MLDPRYNPPYRLPKNPRDWIDPRRIEMQLNRQRTLEQARNNPNDPMNWRNPPPNEMRLNHLRTVEQNKNNPISHSQFREDYSINNYQEKLFFQKVPPLPIFAAANNNDVVNFWKFVNDTGQDCYDLHVLFDETDIEVLDGPTYFDEYEIETPYEFARPLYGPNSESQTGEQYKDKKGNKHPTNTTAIGTYIVFKSQPEYGGIVQHHAIEEISFSHSKKDFKIVYFWWTDINGNSIKKDGQPLVYEYPPRYV